jgi:hypothetical protein
MNNSKIYLLRPDVVASVVEDGAVLLDLETKYFYSVNSSGWAILQMFETGTSPEIALSHCRDWSGKEQIDPAIVQFINTLEEENLIEISDQILPEEETVYNGVWTDPTIEKQKEPLQRIMTSAFDPTMPLAE